jgi:hypothetical protein
VRKFARCDVIGDEAVVLHDECAAAYDDGGSSQNGLTIIGDCSAHASCKLCHGTGNVKRIKDGAIANCPVLTLHETCAVAYFARMKDAPLM